MAKVSILAERCKSCGLCIIACPQGCLKRRDKINSQGYFPVYLSDEEKCKGCALCAIVCPDVCFEIYK
jgi:2-oxoglutarate ferredoxin oxidoreductase subunit delta